MKTLEKFMVGLFVVFLLFLGVVVPGWWKKTTTASSARLEALKTDSARLQYKADSLEAEISVMENRDTVYVVRYRVSKQETQERKDSVASLSADKSLRFFAQKTGVDSIAMTPDSVAQVPAPAIKAADILFVEGEGAKQQVGILEQRLQAKDTTLCLYRQRLITGDSLFVVNENKNRTAITILKNDNTQLTKNVKTQKLITGGAIIGWLVTATIAIFK